LNNDDTKNSIFINVLNSTSRYFYYKLLLCKKESIEHAARSQQGDLKAEGKRKKVYRATQARRSEEIYGSRQHLSSLL